MGAPLCHVGFQAICPHAGQVTAIPSSPRVMVGGQPVVTLSDTYLVAGCPFTVPGPKPQPCVKVQWLVPAMRVLVGGQPAILQSSNGLCLSPEQIPQGPPSVLVTQVRAMGT
jgi:hypothetical protein